LTCNVHLLSIYLKQVVYVWLSCIIEQWSEGVNWEQQFSSVNIFQRTKEPWFKTLVNTQYARPMKTIIYNHLYNTVDGESRPGFLTVLLLLYTTNSEVVHTALEILSLARKCVCGLECGIAVCCDVELFVVDCVHVIWIGWLHVMIWTSANYAWKLL
jgi:hypothetical protein